MPLTVRHVRFVFVFTGTAKGETGQGHNTEIKKSHQSPAPVIHYWLCRCNTLARRLQPTP
jgi:hypothetical protein